MTKTRQFLSMCYGDPSATEVPPCCETATNKLTFSTTSVLLLLNMPLSLSRATIFRRQKNPRRVYRPKIAGILFVCNEPEGKYYTVPITNVLAVILNLASDNDKMAPSGKTGTGHYLFSRYSSRYLDVARSPAPALDAQTLESGYFFSLEYLVKVLRVYNIPE